MNCENCGKEEVNFHFTSNINGNITEKHLCAECAGKLGYTDKAMYQPDMSFEEIFTDLFGGRPSRRMFGGYGMMIPTFIIPTFGMVVPGNREPQPVEETQSIQPELEKLIPAEVTAVVDEEMKKRREINILREQMNTAAAEENFEKAAALRDSIRRLESGGNL